jgi:uncharacterized membrane protein
MQKLQNQQNKKGSISVSQTSIYSGKLPWPEMMQQYNVVEPSFANRILTMAEEEQQKHIHRIENKQLNVSVITAIFGIISGLIALGTLCYLLYLAIEKQNTAISLGITGIMATVITVFVINRSKSK